MKCEICKEKIQTTFMNKIIGTLYTKGKKRYGVCNSCQSKLTVTEIKQKLNL